MPLSDDRCGCSTTASSEDHVDRCERRRLRFQGASSSIDTSSMEPPAILATAVVLANPGQAIAGPTATGVEAFKSPTCSSDGFQLGAEACSPDGTKCGLLAAPKHKEMKQRDDVIQNMVSMLAEEGKLWESRVERMASDIEDLKTVHAKQVHDLQARIARLGRENRKLRQLSSTGPFMGPLSLTARPIGQMPPAASVPGSLAAPVATGPALIARALPVRQRRASSSSPCRRLSTPLVVQSGIGCSTWASSNQVRSAAVPFHDSSGRLLQAPFHSARAVPTAPPQSVRVMPQVTVSSAATL